MDERGGREDALSGIRLLASGLPLVRDRWAWPLRLLVIAAGLLAVGVPAWELGPALWPPNIATPVFGLIIAGAGSLASVLVRAGLRGEAREWVYPPGAVVVRRSLWRARWETRLEAEDVASIDTRRIESMEGDDRWRVALVPMPGKNAGVAAFETGDFATREKAEAVRQALREHLGMAQATVEGWSRPPIGAAVPESGHSPSQAEARSPGSGS